MRLRIKIDDQERITTKTLPRMKAACQLPLQ